MPAAKKNATRRTAKRSVATPAARGKTDTKRRQPAKRRSSRRAPHSLLEMSPRSTSDRDLYNVVIETPKGSQSKLDYDPELDVFKLGSIMPQGMAFPFDFGFVPGTLAADGDPVDVLLLMESPTPHGVVVPARLIGVIEAVQTEHDGKSSENDRLIAVAPASPLYENINRLSDLPTQLCQQIEHFFVTYNAEHGKKFELKGMHGPRRAEKVVKRARRAFKRKKK